MSKNVAIRFTSVRCPAENLIHLNVFFAPESIYFTNIYIRRLAFTATEEANHKPY